MTDSEVRRMEAALSSVGIDYHNLPPNLGPWWFMCIQMGFVDWVEQLCHAPGLQKKFGVEI